MLLKKGTGIVFGLVCLVAPFFVSANATSSLWLDEGWNQIEKNQHEAAIAIWQEGVNTLPDKQLLGSLGFFSEYANALERLKLAGRQEKVFIIHDPQESRGYHLLTAQEVLKDINLRQIQLAALKQKTGMQGKLLANESRKFKSPLSPEKLAILKQQALTEAEQKRAAKAAAAAEARALEEAKTAANQQRIAAKSEAAAIKRKADADAKTRVATLQLKAKAEAVALKQQAEVEAKLLAKQQKAEADKKIAAMKRLAEAEAYALKQKAEAEAKAAIRRQKAEADAKIATMKKEAAAEATALKQKAAAEAKAATMKQKAEADAKIAAMKREAAAEATALKQKAEADAKAAIMKQKAEADAKIAAMKRVAEAEATALKLKAEAQAQAIALRQKVIAEKKISAMKRQAEADAKAAAMQKKLEAEKKITAMRQQAEKEATALKQKALRDAKLAAAKRQAEAEADSLAMRERAKQDAKNLKLKIEAEARAMALKQRAKAEAEVAALKKKSDSKAKVTSVATQKQEVTVYATTAKPSQTMLNRASLEAGNPDWIDEGWQYFEQQDYATALLKWQRGLNGLSGDRLLATLGAFSQLGNAVNRLQKVGPEHKAMIIRSNMNGRDIYYVLSASHVPADIFDRQEQLKSLKKAAGISGFLLACESKKFRSGPISDNHFANIKLYRNITPAKKVVARDIWTAIESQSFTINRFEVSGNKLLPTDFILISLRDYYGDERPRSDIKQIRNDVISLYQMSGYAKVKVNLPEQVDGDTIAIQIDEKRIRH